ncbi:hypothetical protein YC2023_109965 [Brassica napus]
MVLESRRVCGKEGMVKLSFSVSGRRRLSQIRHRRTLHPQRGSFLSSAVVGSSLRGVKAFTASRRRISPPILAMAIDALRFQRPKDVCGEVWRSCGAPFWSRDPKAGSPAKMRSGGDESSV